jgi:hypothetical protein
LAWAALFTHSGSSIEDVERVVSVLLLEPKISSRKPMAASLIV